MVCEAVSLMNGDNDKMLCQIWYCSIYKVAYHYGFYAKYTKLTLQNLHFCFKKIGEKT